MDRGQFHCISVWGVCEHQWALMGLLEPWHLKSPGAGNKVYGTPGGKQVETCLELTSKAGTGVRVKVNRT